MFPLVQIYITSGTSASVPSKTINTAKPCDLHWLQMSPFSKKQISLSNLNLFSYVEGYGGCKCKVKKVIVKTDQITSFPESSINPKCLCASCIRTMNVQLLFTKVE